MSTVECICTHGSMGGPCSLCGHPHPIATRCPFQTQAFPSLDESDRIFRDALAYGLFVTDPAVVLLVTVEWLKFCVRHHDANSSEIPKRLYEEMWEGARAISSPAYYKRLEALGRAMAVHREMITKMEKMP